MVSYGYTVEISTCKLLPVKDVGFIAVEALSSNVAPFHQAKTLVTSIHVLTYQRQLEKQQSKMEKEKKWN